MNQTVESRDTFEVIAEGKSTPPKKKEFFNIQLSKSYLIIGAVILAFLILFVLILIVIIKRKKKNRKVAIVESKLQHLKELKAKGKISERNYHTESENLLNRINKILGGKSLIFILGTIGLIGLFVTLPKQTMTGGVIGGGDSNFGTTGGFEIFAVLVVLSLIGIFLVLVYILREIKNFTKGKASFYSFHKNPELNNVQNEEKVIKQVDKKINTKPLESRISKIINKKVFTDSGDYIGEIKEVLLGKNRIDSLGVKLDKNQAFNVKGIIVKYSWVKNVGHVVIINSKVLERINSLGY